ncbi:MAG: hypothetical protein M2R45_02514 [Verrucomicrobia subdivision 3 bacterium]|nr:hypothetical protein [Limisphaerales bacterium]MCS1414279.1 hypothetical protein [Limisphaerales bacterium]
MVRFEALVYPTRPSRISGLRCVHRGLGRDPKPWWWPIDHPNMLVGFVDTVNIKEPGRKLARISHQ